MIQTQSKTVTFRFSYEDPKNIKVRLPGMSVWPLDAAIDLGLVVPEEVGGDIVSYKTSKFFDEIKQTARLQVASIYEA